MRTSNSETELHYVLIPWDRDAVVLAFDPAMFPKVSHICLPGAEQRRLLRDARKAAQIPPLAEQMHAYLAGERIRFATHDLDLRGFTPFRLAVSLAAARIPYGQIWSYGRLAAAAKSPRASRAAGQVMASNPLPVVIPCHRVVGSNGGLCGFRGGLSLKRRLLELEGVALRGKNQVEKPRNGG
jgi:methylated-DNA-[protein]-cysteine S-methyltransferase